MPSIRTFIAIDVPAVLREACAELIADMRTHRSSAVKWVRPASIHLTLKFLGDVPVGQLPHVFDALNNAVEGQAPFHLVTAPQPGAFPNFRRPRVFWIGFRDQGLARLNSLQTGIEAALADCGFPPEKRAYHPHLTVARVREGRLDRALLTALQEYRMADHELPVERVAVMKSELTGRGAVYTVQHSVTLQNSKI